MDESAILNQCCGTETVYSGSVSSSSSSSDFGKFFSLLVQVTIPGPDPHPDLDFLVQFKKIVRNLDLLNVTVEAALLPRKLPSNFLIFLLFFYFCHSIMSQIRYAFRFRFL
jgi:hypothetical protein